MTEVKQAKPASQINVRGTAQLHSHPKADDVPSPDPEQYEEMVQDIELRGIQVPLDILEDGTVLDGRTRLSIAQALGIQAVPIRVIDPPDPYDYMILAAASRRHLTKSQRAALYVLSPSWTKVREDAAERIKAGKADEEAASSAKKAAEKLGVGKTTVDEASGLSRKAPELLKAVAAGDLTTTQAVAITKDKELHDKVKKGEVTAKQAAKSLKTEDQLAKEHDIKRLRTHAPDLAEAMESKQITLKGALRILEEREAELSTQQDATENGEGLPVKPLHDPSEVMPRQLHEAIQSIRQAPARVMRTRLQEVVKAMLSAGKPFPKSKEGLTEYRDCLSDSIALLQEQLDRVASALLMSDAPPPSDS